MAKKRLVAYDDGIEPEMQVSEVIVHNYMNLQNNKYSYEEVHFKVKSRRDLVT